MNHEIIVGTQISLKKKNNMTVEPILNFHCRKTKSCSPAVYVSTTILEHFASFFLLLLGVKNVDAFLHFQ